MSNVNSALFIKILFCMKFSEAMKYNHTRLQVFREGSGHCGCIWIVWILMSGDLHAFFDCKTFTLC